MGYHAIIPRGSGASSSVFETYLPGVHLLAEATLTVAAAITESSIITNASDTDGGATATTVTFNRTANQLCLVFVVNHVSSGTANQPTFTQTGATWTAVDSQLFNGDLMRVTLFRSMASSTVSGVAGTIDCGGQNQTLIGWVGRAFAGIDLRGVQDNGAATIIQSVKNSVAGGTSLTLTLGAIESDGSAASSFYAASAANNFTAPTGYTENFESGTTPEFSQATDLATAATAAGPSFSATVDAAGIAIEIRKDPNWIAGGRFQYVAARHSGQTNIYPIINQARTSGGGAGDFVVADIYDETDDDEPGSQSFSTWAKVTASVFTVPESCYDEGSALALSSLEDLDVYAVRLGAVGDINCGYKAWSASIY